MPSKPNKRDFCQTCGKFHWCAVTIATARRQCFRCWGASYFTTRYFFEGVEVGLSEWLARFPKNGTV